MQGLHGKFHVFPVDEHRNLDFRCRNDLNVDPFGAQHLEHLRGDPSMGTHPYADNRHLGYVGIGNHLLIVDDTVGFGLLCTIPISIIFIILSSMMLNNYTKEHTELFGV